MDDLEAEIGRWADTMVTGVDPVTADEAVSLARSHSRPRRLLIGVVAALALVVIIGGAAVVGLRRAGPVNVRTGGTSPTRTTTTVCQRITTVPSTVPPNAGTDNPLVKASLAPNGEVAVGDGLTKQHGWVTWAAFQDISRPAPVTDTAGHLVGYFGHQLGWIDISAYNDPCFNYPALVAAAQHKINEEEATEAPVQARNRAMATLVQQYAEVSRQAGPVASGGSYEQDPPSPSDPQVTTYQLKDAKGSFTAAASLDMDRFTLTIQIGPDEYDFDARGDTFVPLGHHVIAPPPRITSTTIPAAQPDR